MGITSKEIVQHLKVEEEEVEVDDRNETETMAKQNQQDLNEISLAKFELLAILRQDRAPKSKVDSRDFYAMSKRSFDLATD